MRDDHSYLGTIEVAERAAKGTSITVLGAINALGYVLCRECADPHDLYLSAILSDNSAHNRDECDMCGVKVNEQ